MKNVGKRPKGERSQGQKLPRGWDEDRVRKVLAHYEHQSDEEAIGEDEAAYEAEGEERFFHSSLRNPGNVRETEVIRRQRRLWSLSKLYSVATSRRFSA